MKRSSGVEMRLKVPPVLVFSVFGVGMFLLDRFLPTGEFNFFGRMGLMTLLIVMAGILGGMALFQFLRARTTLDPTVPDSASSLVTGGPYRISRNPMYLAMLLLLISWGIWLGNAFNALLIGGFVAYMDHFQIGPEEEALRVVFGKEYEQYCTRVRRWF